MSQGVDVARTLAIAAQSAAGASQPRSVALDAVSGVNTGDQDLTGLVHSNRSELDLVSGTNTGDETQSSLLSKIASAVTGVILTVQQGASELGSAVKFRIKNALGVDSLVINGNGQVGIGAVPTAKVHIVTTETTADAMGQKTYYTTTSPTGVNNNGAFFDVTSNPATNATSEVQGVYGNARTAVGSTVNHNAVFGMRFSARHNGTGVLTSATGIYAYPYNGGDGTITSAYAMYTKPWLTKGLIASWYGYFVDLKTLGTGAITNLYGIYIKEPSAKNYFAGSVGIGTPTPTSALHVVGLPVYADNAAALAGGLTAGAIYRLPAVSPAASINATVY